jgi:hypothetical protein
MLPIALRIGWRTPEVFGYREAASQRNAYDDRPWDPLVPRRSARNIIGRIDQTPR